VDLEAVKKALLGTITLLAAAQLTWGSVIFDDFNLALASQHFNQPSLSYSGTTAGITTDGSSVSTWDTTTGDGILEGTGMDFLHVIKSTSASTVRVRWLSGLGTPANNTSFTASGSASGNDGRIGLYLKAPASDGSTWVVSLNLDAPANTSATMSWSGDQTIIADGAWHLYEWQVNTTSWGQVPGLGGQTAGVLTAGTHTFDSIYIRNLSTLAASSTYDFYVDFLAKTDDNSTSVSTLLPVVPEPSSLTLGLLGGFGLLVAWFRRR
jgi:hypothetical protein